MTLKSKSKAIAISLAMLSTAFARPAEAAGLVTAINPVAGFAIDFILSASSNTSAAVDVWASSHSQGLVTNRCSDTGFFWASAECSATSGFASAPPGYADQYGKAYAEWFLRKDNVHYTVEPKPLLIGPDGIDGHVTAVSDVKGFFRVLLGAVASPENGLGSTSALETPQMLVPVKLDIPLIPNVSVTFSIKLVYADGFSVDIASGGAGRGNNWLQTPYLSSIDPALASLVNDQYLSILAHGTGNVNSFYLGDGILPVGSDGLPGIPMYADLGREFSLDSTLEADNFAAIPEPGSWTLMIVGCGMTGAVLRRRRASFARLGA